MKNFLLLTKTLFVVTLFCIGATNAWADPTTLYERGTTNAWATADVGEGGWSAGTITEGLAAAGGQLSHTVNNGGYTVTKTISPTSNYVVSMTASAILGRTGRAGAYNFVTIGGAQLRVDGQSKTAQVFIDGVAQGSTVSATRDASYTFNVSINQKTGNVTYSVSGGATIASTTTSTSTAISSVSFGYVKNGSVGNLNTTLTSINITEEPAASTASVTYKYEDTSGTDLSSLKADVVKSEEVGATISDLITSALNASFYNGDASLRYDYSTFVCEDATVPAGGTTVTLKFAPKAKYTYTVRALDGSANVIDDNIASGYVYAGESVTVAYPQYVLSGTTLYKIANNGSGDWYRKVITPNADSYVYDLTYNNGTVANAVLYNEAEDITGFTAYGNNANRASNGEIAHSSGAYKDLTSLAPGKYQVYTRSIRGNSGTHKLYVKCGEDVVGSFDVENGTNVAKNTDEFTVYTTSTLSVASEGGSTAGLDWIYVVKTGDATVTITPANAKSTYVTTYALDFTDVEGLDAYVATAAANGSVTLSEVGAVPAGTPLMLIGTASTEYTVPVVASASAPAENMFVAGDGTTEFDGSTFDYILYSDGLFYKIGSGTVATTKAYLHCDNDPTAAGARGLRISFGGNITGVANVEAAAEAGQKEGKFFKDGKFFIFKNGKKYNAAGSQVK